MLYRIIFYLLGIFIASLGLTTIIIYLSYSNLGFSILENIILIIKNPATYYFIIGTIISLIALLYDLLKNK